MDTDVNYKSYVNENNLIINTWTNPEEPSMYDDVMKFSNCSNVIVDGVTINGGSEDCIDAVRGSNYTFQNLVLKPFRDGITLKGSIDGWNLKNILFLKKGASYTIEVGQYDNYWKIGRAPTRNGTIENVNVVDGSKIYVILWDADKPKLINCPDVRLIKIPCFIWFPYFCVQGFRRYLTDRFFKKK